MTRRHTLAAAFAATLIAAAIYAEGPGDFVPDVTFKGSSLTGWHTLGQAAWKAENGELAATPGEGGGWLILDKSYQDLQFFGNFRCAAECKAGVLVRAAKTADGGVKGIYISLNAGDFATYNLTLDAQGKEIAREKLKAPPAAGRGGGGGGRGGGGGAAGGGRGGGGGGRGGPVLHAGDWNEFLITISGSALRPALNNAIVPNGLLDDSSTYGSIGLYAGGSGEVRFRDIAWKDINSIVQEKERTSPHFTMQHLIDPYYGWGASAADINHDGVLDVIVGPFYFLGPGYTERRIYREGRTYNPSTEYAPDMVNYAYDFTGDGWPDILSTEMRAMALYVNPKGEPRRWDRYMVLPDIVSEIVVMRDIDGDGKQEIVYGDANGYAWAKYDPANPTAVWKPHRVSSGNRANIHGLGVGDVNGDGRLDVVTPAGWYEQPAGGATQENWVFHESDFGITAPLGVLPGGGEMGVYDVNGDGKNDIVTSLAAHDWGLAWFEQKRDAGGAISFVKHRIAGDYSTKNAGGVVFSEPHATAFADMDGDGIPDFIVGKSMFHHLENYNGPDPYGPAVVYVYRTVRNPKAEGGAEFVPELVNNRSGVGSKIAIADLNGDGAPDILTASGKGAFVFFGKPGKWPKASGR
jgi:hypothetical protein